MWWRRHLDVYDLVTENHFHDLGKLCFAFTAFWGYLTFGQYLVIWYGNMGEETHWARLRLIAPWLKLTLPVVFLVFVLPFFGLLSRAAKVYLPDARVLRDRQPGRDSGSHRYLEVYPSLHYEVTRRAARALGDRRDARLPRHLGPLLRGVHGCVPAHARDAHDVAVPGRGAGAGDPETMEPLPAHE